MDKNPKDVHRHYKESARMAIWIRNPHRCKHQRRQKIPATRTGARKATPSTTRAPLIVKPSAQGRPWKMPSEQDRQAPNGGMGIPAGAGGGGAKVGPDGVVLEGKTSEEIAQMHRQSEAQAAAGGKEPQRRGDGTILQERGDIPKNPKKKAFDAGADESKPRAKRDEL